MNRGILFKVAIWRGISITTMLLTIWIYTGDFFSATGITVLVQIVQTIAHFIFEVWWENHKPGK
ncbi:MAG TPA: DUF2061 domain-containing protein [Flavobacteriales bacterium]|jgi:uncharacterized membrane protein|nr:DUF2061 domain-containing protein [Flavobacteriales bacterium]